jgi:hypothetical protein
MYYDYRVVNEEVVDLPNGRLVFKRVSKDLLRITKDVNGYKASKVLNVREDSTLSLRPLPPSGTSINVDYILIKFSEPITLIPKSSMTLEVKIPVDLGVYVGNSLADSVPLSKVKYALYGPPDLGVLCRYIDQGITNTVSPKVLGSINIIVNSVLDTVLSVSRVVIPINGLITYLTYDDEIFFNVVEVRVTDKNRIEVYTKDKPSVSREVRFKYRSSGKELTYVMMYGA